MLFYLVEIVVSRRELEKGCLRGCPLCALTTQNLKGGFNQPGQYKVTWEGTGGDVQAMILSSGKLVVTVPAHLTDLNQPERNDTVESRKNDDGSQSLARVDFAGKKYALSFDNEAANTGSTSSAGSH